MIGGGGCGVIGGCVGGVFFCGVWLKEVLFLLDSDDWWVCLCLCVVFPSPFGLWADVFWGWGYWWGWGWLWRLLPVPWLFFYPCPHCPPLQFYQSKPLLPPTKKRTNCEWEIIVSK